MKFFSTLCFLSFFALAYCAAVATQESEYEAAKREVTESNAKFLPETLPDGKNSISVYNGDVFEGSIVEGDDGEVIVYDAFGKVLDLDVLGDDESLDLENGMVASAKSPIRILGKFARFIKKYGVRAWVSDAIWLHTWHLGLTTS